MNEQKIESVVFWTVWATLAALAFMLGINFSIIFEDTFLGAVERLKFWCFFTVFSYGISFHPHIEQ